MASVTIPFSYIENYARTINDLDALNQDLLADALANTDLSDKRAVAALMRAICQTSNEQAQELATAFYRGLSLMETGKDVTYRVKSGWDEAATDVAVSAIMRDYEGDPEGMAKQLSQRLSYEINRASKRGVYRAGKADGRQVRYARVPVGVETCAWCIMTAGLGFWYMTEEAASHSHGNCVVGDTEVYGTGLLACMRREYQGPLVHIVTAKRRELTVTPNHPILTTGGWKCAGDLVEGDNLLCAPLGHGHEAGAPDVSDAPPTAQQLFEAASLRDATVFHGMPAAAKDLYSEMFPDCDVNVVSPDGLLKRAIKTSIGKPTEHEGLTRAGLLDALTGLTLDGGGSECELFRSGLAATGSVMRSSGLCLSLLGGHGGGPQEASFGASAMGEASFTNPTVNDVSAHASATGDGVDALAALERFENTVRWSEPVAARLDALALEGAEDGRFAYAESLGYLVDLDASGVEVDQILSLDVSERSCHVYNLSTEGGWYVSSGIITHNCDCVIVADMVERPRTGDYRDVRVEGYDSSMYREMYQRANALRANGDLPQGMLDHITDMHDLRAMQGRPYRDDTNGTLYVMRHMYGLK